MGISVDADNVSACGRIFDNIGVFLYTAPHDKKGRLDAVPVENVQDGRRLLARAVVKGQIADIFIDGLIADRRIAVNVGMQRLVCRGGLTGN